MLALMGAPGAFPVQKNNWWLQKFMRWSVKIEKEAKQFIKHVLNNEPFVGIHLRNGIDFVSSNLLDWTTPKSRHILCAVRGTRGPFFL